MIVITTPTGNIGRRVLEHVRDKEKIRVIARDPANVPAGAKVEIIRGSHDDAAVCERAFAGADAVLWVAPPASPRAPSLESVYSDFARPACEALKRHRVPRVVGVSALGRGQAVNAGYVTASFAMEDQIASTGIAYRALAMPSFMENVLRQADAIKTRGVFVGTIRPDLKLPLVAARDIASVAARWLLDRTWTGVAEVPVLGAEDLSHDDMARILSDVLGKPVRYQQITPAAMKATMLERGTSEAVAQGRIDMMNAKDRGLDNGVVRTADNTTPTTFRQWCEENLR